MPTVTLLADIPVKRRDPGRERKANRRRGAYPSPAGRRPALTTWTYADLAELAVATGRTDPANWARVVAASMTPAPASA